MFLESLWSAHQRLGSGGLTGSAADGTMAPDLHKYQFEFDVVDDLKLSRSFTRDAVQDEQLPLSVAIKETTSSQLQWSMFGRTQLSFTSASTGLMGLDGSPLSSTDVRTMGLTQGLGGGSSGTMLGFTEQVTSTTGSTAKEQVTTQRQYTLKSGLADNWDLSMKLCDTEADKAGGLWTRDFSGTLAAPFSGGTGKLSLVKTTSVSGGVESKTQKVDCVLPLRIAGGQAVAEHHTTYARSAAEEATRLSRLSMPLRLFGENSSFEHKIEEKLKSAMLTERKTTVLQAPFTIRGKTVGHKETFISEDVSGATTETFSTELTMPISGGNAWLHRQVKTKPAVGEEQEWKQEQIVARSPSFRIGAIGAFNASRSTTETVGEETLRVTNLDLKLRPFDPLDVDAKWQLRDSGPSASVKSRNVSSRLAVGDDLQVSYRFSEEEVVEKSPTILRHLEVATAPKKDASVGLSAGYLTYGADGTETDPAALVKISLGKPAGVQVNATYSEFDQKKLVAYEQDPCIELTLKHSPRNDKSVQLRYQDQEGRVDAERGIGVVFGALGGSLQLGYSQNALGPDGKKIRRADVYDAALARELFGALNVKLGIRYCDYIDPQIVDQHYDLRLDGGKEDDWGKLAVSYASGDFAPNPRKTSVPPTSVLNLTYSRTWGDLGRLSLSVSRETAPDGTLTDDGRVNGQLRYDMDF